MAGLNANDFYLDGSHKSYEIRSSYQHPQVISAPNDAAIYAPYVSEHDCYDDNVKKYIGDGCGFASLITETLLIHPCIVLRRQCQVNPGALKYHLVPFTLLPVILRLHQTQGIYTLWKGIGSVLVVRGMLMAVENVISKITLFPTEFKREYEDTITIKRCGQHILLKCISAAIVTPFYSASLVETVQSEIASENPGIFDIFRDGAFRLVEVSNKGRLIPIYALLPPTITYWVAKYLFTCAVKNITCRTMMTRYKYLQETSGAYSRHIVRDALDSIELKSTLFSICAADILFYPFETVIHRLHLQGTRTIIDNLDTGNSVTPLLTGYSGARDCYQTIISTEGPFGLFKGFGALILQFSIHFAILSGTKWILTELDNMFHPKKQNKKERIP